MSINESDKPTVGSTTVQNAEQQVDQTTGGAVPASTAPAPYQINAGVTDAADHAHEIGGGATAADYQEALKSTGSAVPSVPPMVQQQSNTTPVSDVSSTSYDLKSSNTPASTPTNPPSSDDKKEDEKKDEDTPTDPTAVAPADDTIDISKYISSAINDEQRNRIIAIVQDWVNNGNCDKSKLLKALEAENVKDSMHLLEIVVEIMSRLYKARVDGAITERRPGIISILAKHVSRANASVRLLGMEDGSVRLSYLNEQYKSVPQKPEQMFKNDPDANAEDVVVAASDWLGVAS